MIFLGALLGLGAVLMSLIVIGLSFHSAKSGNTAIAVPWLFAAGLGIYLLIPRGRAIRADLRLMLLSAIVVYLGAFAVCSGVLYTGTPVLH